MTPTGPGEAGKLQVRPRPGSPPPTLGVRRVAIAMAGFSVLLLGLALLVVPVPGTTVVVIPLGLTILAREFGWARRLRDWSTAGARHTWARVRGSLRGRRLASAGAHRL